MPIQLRTVLLAGIDAIRRIAGVDPLDETAGIGTELKQVGQIVVIFALMLTVVIGLVGIAIDTTYAWRESLRVQRAADAAALAGVVYMPSDFGTASSSALAESKMNGMTNDGTITIVTPAQVLSDPRELRVTITTQVPTFFSRIFGINSWAVSRSSLAVYILPVPMGSPENYYGSFGTYTVNGSPVVLKGPNSETMTAHGFWGSILTQGADIVNGDAYMPKFNGSGANPNPQDTLNYYNYTVLMPKGTTNGKVYIFDPAFCATDQVQGTGEVWLGGSGAVSTYYELYNTLNQPYNLGAQQDLGGSGTRFTNDAYSDSKEGGSGGSSCTTGKITDINDGEYYHNKWWELTGSQGANQTLTGGTSDEGTTYRVHVSTDPGNTTQDGVNATNDFAIFATATGGTPKVYGSGAMEMYTPLPGNTNSSFYLAAIDAQQGAGKTVEISLWDPGDTGNLTAALSFQMPTSATSWVTVPFSWSAVKVASSGANCNGHSTGTVMSVTTSTSSSNHIFNGCWLTIDIGIPQSYASPITNPWWWKITYAMTGSGNSTDLTTWQVSIRGNPVHLL
jgi:Putative Flp pilus-assembly TadE/G-like